MKRTTIFLGCIGLAAFTIGCDERTLSNLPTDVQSMITSYTGLKTDIAARPIQLGTQDQMRDRDPLHLRDGSCDNDGNLYGGSNGYGGNGSGPGDGTGSGDQDRLRDGSCGD